MEMLGVQRGTDASPHLTAHSFSLASMVAWSLFASLSLLPRLLLSAASPSLSPLLEGFASDGESAVSQMRIKRVIGGVIATAHERYQFAPSIRTVIFSDEYTYQCGATVISKRHLLTAAHCVVVAYPVGPGPKSGKKLFKLADEVWVNMELVNDVFDRNRSHFNVTGRFYVHPSYQTEKFNNDLAVLEMPPDFDFGVEPIRLAADFVENEGEMAFTVGYGKYNINESMPDTEFENASLHLREGVFEFREPSFCENVWTKPDTRRKICAGELGRGVALGDSGGPLMKNGDDGKWYQVGVCSYGKRNATYNSNSHPGIHTRVSFYCPWIERVTRGEVRCVGYERRLQENVVERVILRELDFDGNASSGGTRQEPTGFLAHATIGISSALILLTL